MDEGGLRYPPDLYIHGHPIGKLVLKKITQKKKKEKGWRDGTLICDFNR